MSRAAVRKASYRAGEDRIKSILKAAESILIESGYHNFSLRKVADKDGISVGNLNYYFPSKESLINALLDGVIVEYLEVFEEWRKIGTPEEQLRRIVTYVFTDLQSKRTTILFPELWSLANHEKGVTKQVDAMYGRYREVLASVIQEINPKLSAKQAMRLSVFFSSSMEGHTIFSGHKKPWTKDTPHFIEMALQSFFWLIKHGEIPDS